MNITQIADEIYRDIDDESITSIPKIAFWLRAKIGALNTLIATSFEIQSDLSSNPEINNAAAAILKEMYWVWYWNKKIQDTLGASGVEVVEFREGDTAIRTTARTEFGKIYMQNKRNHQETLDDLVFKYRHNLCNVLNVDSVSE